jgi:2-polyprenyl-6-methoxyphenol hydroxylase-like FAD-dependent oxidoreductase
MGAVMMIPRTDVIDLLREACGDVDISMDTTVDALTQSDNQVEVTLSDGSDATFDLVVACDGIHSDLRTMVFGEQKPFDTGWLLWTWWADVPEWPAEIIREFWGPGRFFGMYPCRSKVMCGIGLPTDQDPGCHDDPDAAKAFLREQHGELIAGEPLVGKAIDGAESFFPWPMTDVRSQDWVNDRVVLCGDAGAAFLPTAGVGASNALRAAAALSDELSRAGPSTVPLALELYEKRCRKVIEGNQHDSRTAAKLMFVENKAVSWGRDHLVKHYPADKIINQIVESMRTPF